MAQLQIQTHVPKIDLSSSSKSSVLLFQVSNVSCLTHNPLKQRTDVFHNVLRSVSEVVLLALPPLAYYTLMTAYGTQ